MNIRVTGIGQPVATLVPLRGSDANMSTPQQRHVEIIRDLANTAGPCITLALAGSETGDTRTEAKSAIASIRRQLEERGATDIEGLLQPVAAAASGTGGDIKSRGGIVILRSPSVMQIYRARSLEPIVRVDDRFDLRTLLCAISDQKIFYLLALSQNRTRILRCTRDASEEIPFPSGFPSSLAEAMQTRQPDHTLDNRSSGGPSMGSGAVLFGTSSDADAKDEYLLHFFRTLDRAVNVALKHSAEPLIPVGVEHEIALYRRVNTYTNLVEPGVHGAPDGLDVGEMHRRALHLLEQRAAEPGREVPADFDKRVGTGHASTRIPEIVAAAFEGRVSHLFFQSSAQYLGTYDPVRQRVKRTDDPLDSPVDLIETAGYETLLRGGEVSLVPGSAMPNGIPVCALFRYPAAQSSPQSQGAESWQ